MTQTMNDIDDIQRLILVKLSSANREVVEFDAIQREINAAPSLISEALRSLLETRRISLRRGIGSDNAVYLSLANDLTESVSLVMDAVRGSGRSGIDQAQIISRTRLGKSEVMKALHTLIENKHIQERRSFTNRAKRIYLLYHLEPSSQVTGGTFYCGEELDVAFVDELRRRIVAFVREQEHAFELRVKRNNTRNIERANSFHYDNKNNNDSNERINVDSIIGDRGSRERNVEWCGVTFDDLVIFVKRQCGDNISKSSTSNRYDSNSVAGDNDNNNNIRVSSPVTVITSQHHDRSQGSENVNKREPPSSSMDFTNYTSNTKHMSNSGAEDTFFSHSNSVLDRPSTLEYQTFPHKQITERDVMRLLNVLVLDGVLQENVHVREDFSSSGVNEMMMSVRNGQLRKRTRTIEHDSEFSFDNDNINNSSNASPFISYTLASQAHNVMRHFTTQRISCTATNNNNNNNNTSITTMTANNTHWAETKNYSLCSHEHEETKNEWQERSCKDKALTVLELLQLGSDWAPAFISTSQDNMAHEYMPAVGFPCMGCPLLASCMVNGKGIVNPYSCVYLHE